MEKRISDISLAENKPTRNPQHFSSITMKEIYLRFCYVVHNKSLNFLHILAKREVLLSICKKAIMYTSAARQN